MTTTETQTGTSYSIEDLGTVKIIRLKYGIGGVQFHLFDLVALYNKPVQNRYFAQIETLDIYGDETQQKFTSVDKAVDYLEENKQNLKRTI